MTGDALKADVAALTVALQTHMTRTLVWMTVIDLGVVTLILALFAVLQ